MSTTTLADTPAPLTSLPRVAINHGRSVIAFPVSCTWSPEQRDGFIATVRTALGAAMAGEPIVLDALNGEEIDWLAHLDLSGVTEQTIAEAIRLTRTAEHLEATRVVTRDGQPVAVELGAEATARLVGAL